MNKKYLLLIYIVLGVLLGFLVSKINFKRIGNIVPKSCTYYGKVYKDGEGFKVDCNSCTCINGEINCTLIACGGS